MQTLTPAAAARGQEFVEQLLRDGTSVAVAKAALAQLMVTRSLAVNGGKKKASGKKLGISREWVRTIQKRSERKRTRLIPLDTWRDN